MEERENERPQDSREAGGEENRKGLSRRAALFAAGAACAVVLLAAGAGVALLRGEESGDVPSQEETTPREETQESGFPDVSKEPESAPAPAPEPSAEEPEEEPDPLKALEEAGVPIPDKEVDFETLQSETNPDIYAWIYIPDTKIDYPVLQHATDNSYYLNYNIDGSKGYPGCIYTENYNAKDFSDPNTVMYGHNMKNGSMFAGLHKFEDSEYFEEHPYVYVYTPEQLYVYEIFAAHEYSNAHILMSFDFADEKVYQKFLDDIWTFQGSKSNFREDVEVDAGDRILTLSTCVAGQSSKRYLVQCVLLNGESAEAEAEEE